MSSPVFSKVLIANRGEIAVRVIRTCREMGVATVAVYSELDYDALHVRLADEAYALPGVSVAESYLNSDAVLAALDRSGADAVHPGYGFFSENADFARAVADRGAVFVGPPPEAVEVMGDKISARAAAEAVGVHSVPGTVEAIVDPAEVEAFGAAHGWPVAIKAAHGGGGRGMRVVAAAEHVAAGVESARREAEAYFGRGELYMERYLSTPRHVEVQVLADAHGTCLHIGTRDCSAQRRHQKLVEEAPAPGIPPEVLERMGGAAVRVARGCGYVNAGTVEFLYDDGEFYYLEMNTRLQVEHPVTEAVTGIDLVEWQLRIAAGESLDFSQEDVRLSGHAIEARVNAEDPADGAFLPCPGRIDRLRPAQGLGIRWDGGYESGDEVSQHYDNLIGKLVVWGRDRSSAIARARRALEETRITGVATTVCAARAIITHPDFAAVAHYTKWVEEQLDLTAAGAPEAVVGQPLSRGGISGSDVGGEAPPDRSGAIQGDRSAAGARARIRREIDVEVDGRRFSVVMWVPETSDTALGSGGAAAHAMTAGERRRQAGDPLRRLRRGRTSSAGAAEPGRGDVMAPMQGTIVKVLVNVGDTVQAGDPIAVLEAMKMENNVTVGHAGTVSELRTAVGDSVGAGDILAVIT